MIKIPTPDGDTAANQPATSGGWFAIARVLRPQGRRGELLCESLTDIEALFQPGAALRDEPEPASEAAAVARTRHLEEAWAPQGRNVGRIVLKIEGVDSISEAETLKGHTFSVQESALPPMEEDAYLVRDLVGCVLFDGEQRVGRVVEVQFAVGPDGRTRLPDAPDLLAVALDPSPEAEPVLIPFVKLWLTSVDLQARQIHMQLPPDLVADLQALTSAGDDMGALNTD